MAQEKKTCVSHSFWETGLTISYADATNFVLLPLRVGLASVAANVG